LSIIREERVMSDHKHHHGGHHHTHKKHSKDEDGHAESRATPPVVAAAESESGGSTTTKESGNFRRRSLETLQSLFKRRSTDAEHLNLKSIEVQEDQPLALHRAVWLDDISMVCISSVAKF